MASFTLIARQQQSNTCSTRPISLSDLDGAIELPAVEFAEAVIASDRNPVSQSNSDAIAAVLDQLVHCSNAGEPLRVWSLYSPAYLSRLFRIQGPFDGEMYDAYAKPLPSEDGSGMQLISIRDVWQRSDGIYGAEVEMTYPAVPMPKRLIIWLSKSDDIWQIEEITGEISFSLP